MSMQFHITNQWHLKQVNKANETVKPLAHANESKTVSVEVINCCYRPCLRLFGYCTGKQEHYNVLNVQGNIRCCEVTICAFKIVYN